MTKITLIISTIFFNSLTIFGQNIPIPENYVVIDSILGDLDNDSVKELVVAFDTKKPDEEYESVPRELRIYKNTNGKWTAWKKSEEALYGSRDGGMMGDPYAGMEIKNGILLISHFGGSSWKWEHTDKYRFQNGEFYLIGYESNNGRPCDHWLNVDYNLLTGKIIVKKEFEACKTSTPVIYKIENETFYEGKLKITLQERHGKEIKIISPKYKHEIYIE